MLPEYDRVIETCRSVLSVLISDFLNNIYIYVCVCVCVLLLLLCVIK